MREKLVAIAFVLVILPTIAQHHVFRRANVRLPSPECYRILQDNRGFVWIATEQGLCRFDGVNTKVYTGEQGIKEKAVYALRKDSKGLIWLVTKTGRILTIRNDKVVDPGFKKKFVNPEISNFGYDLFFQKDNMYIPLGISTAMVADKNRKTVRKVADYTQVNYSLVARDGNLVLPLNICLPRRNMPTSRVIRYVDRQNPTNSRFIQLPLESVITPQIITGQLNQRSFFSVSSELVEIDAKGKAIIHHFPHRILSLFTDSRGGLWVGVFGHGVYHIDKGDFSKQLINSLPGLSVSNIMEDREGHIWCTTLEKGVYSCQNPQLLAFNNFSGLNRRADVLTASQHELLVSTKENEIISINSLLQPERIRLFGNAGERIVAIRYLSGKWLIGYKERLTSGIRTNGSIVLSNHNEYQDLQGIKFDEFRGTTYVQGYHSMFRYEKDKAHFLFNSFAKSIRDFLVLGENKFLLSSVEELYIVSLKNGKANVRIIARPSVTISKLFLTRGNRLFVLTKGEGLFELIGEKLVNQNQRMKIPTTVLNDAVEDKQGNLWMATNEGLLKIPRDKNGYGEPKLYDELHGLPSRVCDKLAIFSNLIAISTTEGLITIPISCTMESRVKPQLIFSQATVNGKPTDIRNAEFKYHENSFLLDFSVLSYHQKGHQISYSLDNGSTVQYGTSAALLQLQNLQPGDYQLNVFGENVFGIKSSKPVRIHFTIFPPFWWSWWFIILCVLVGIAVLFLTSAWIRKRTELRAEKTNFIQMQLARSQLSALQAQMNPHFLFNSISSIQNFIMSNKREEAYDYLTSFSKLIRRTLNNSRSQLISLAEEIETIKLYMQLEQRRYNNRFDFYVEVSAEIVLEEVLLPASLIQPLLENAVWHGIAPLGPEKRGLITLKITAEDSFLRITVIDNGVGIQTSNSRNESLAIAIIEEQLTILNHNSAEKRDTSVKLRVGDDGQGTIASFTIPYIKKNENITG